MIQLSIIIVVYNNAALVIDCLKTIFEQTPDLSFEVLLVDNHSSDNSRDFISEHYPALQWIGMNYNSGFARANNAGIRQAKGNAVLLLNADTLIENKAIERCFKEFWPSPYVACGVQLINPDRSPQISGNYFMTGGLNNLLPLPYLGNGIRWLGQRLKVSPPNIPDSDKLMEVDWINGAFLMVRRSAFESAGLLDEDFFLYAEEAEWCYRLRKTGSIALFGSIKVVHLQGETANQVFGYTGKGYQNLFNRKGLQIMLSNFVRIRKQFGWGWYLLNLLVYTTEIPIFLTGLIFSLLIPLRKRKYSFGQFIPFCGNVFFIWRMSPMIISGKPHFYKVL